MKSMFYEREQVLGSPRRQCTKGISNSSMEQGDRGHDQNTLKGEN
jgi:hypothetical protein